MVVNRSGPSTNRLIQWAASSLVRDCNDEQMHVAVSNEVAFVSMLL
jgi:hypothetical protein